MLRTDEALSVVTSRCGELNDTDARIGLLAGRGAGGDLPQAAICWARGRGKQPLRWRRLNCTAALNADHIQSGTWRIESTAHLLVIQVTNMIRF